MVLSQFIKLKVKQAVSFVTAFENIIANEAKRMGYDGVVCGHIHKAELKRSMELSTPMMEIGLNH